MFASLIPFLEDLIDASPAIIAPLLALLARKQQQYATVLAAEQAETAAGAAQLEAAK